MIIQKNSFINTFLSTTDWPVFKEEIVQNPFSNGLIYRAILIRKGCDCRQDVSFNLEDGEEKIISILTDIVINKPCAKDECNNR